MEQFDHFAWGYRHLLDRCVGISGEDSEYFSQYKARYIARKLDGVFDGNLLDFGCGVGRLYRAVTGVGTQFQRHCNSPGIWA